ncbi:MAG: ABC transporter permease [Armatimonadetes bacterium]|nr:ABC transporter permease [Armatimonadota bacterium]
MDPSVVLVLAQKELKDSFRSRWFVVFAGVFAGLALALVAFSMSGAASYGISGFGRTGASLVNLVLLIAPLMGLTLGALGLAGEQERGTLAYLLAQPLGMLELLVGKYLGMALAILGALSAGFGVSAVVILAQGGYADGGDFLALMILSYLLALVSLSLGFLLASLVRSSVTALGAALFVWLMLVFVGDLGLMGTALVLRFKIDTLFVAALVNPLQVFKMASVIRLGTQPEVLGPVGVYASRTYGSHLMALLVSILLVWIAAPLAGSVALFSRRGAA